MGKAMLIWMDHSRGFERWSDDKEPAFVAIAEAGVQFFGLCIDCPLQQRNYVCLYIAHFRPSPLVTVNGMDSVDANEVHLNGLVSSASYSVFECN